MHVARTLKRVGFGVLGFLACYPFLVALICWLLTLWHTYVVLLVVSFMCYASLRRRLGSRVPKTLSRGMVERVPYEPALEPTVFGADEWES